jgi:hypothetical protein
MTACGAQDGETALDIAKHYDKTDIVELLTRAAVRLAAVSPVGRMVSLNICNTQNRTHHAPDLPSSPCWAPCV